MKPRDRKKFFPREATRKVISALMLSAVITGAGFSAWSANINGQTGPSEMLRIVSGVVSDSVCGKGHTINGRGDRECTRLCVKLGASYALISGRSLFILKGHEAELNEFAGQRVIVAGAVSRNTIRVESVAPFDLLHGEASSAIE